MAGREDVWNFPDLKKEQVFIEKEDGLVMYLFCESEKYPKMVRQSNKARDNVDSPESDNKDMFHGEATSDFDGKSLMSESLDGSVRLAPTTFIESRRTFCNNRLGRTVKRENPVELSVTTLADTTDVLEGVMSWTSKLCLDGDIYAQCVSAA